MKVGKAHQRAIREERALIEQRETVPLDGCYVETITREEAESIILVYEWLRSMPTRVKACYGLRAPDGELLGAAVFGNGPGSESGAHICGSEYRGLAVCLERGACVPHTHEHAPSFFVNEACKQAAADHGWRIFYAYSDPTAGEIGTIYQALNWLYIGAGVGRTKCLTIGKDWRYSYRDPDGKKLTSKALRARLKKEGKQGGIAASWQELGEAGWTRHREYSKGKYVYFYGGDRRERRKLRKALKPKVLPYPKRVRKRNIGADGHVK